MTIAEAKKSLDKVIAKSRIHLYKPLQVAEILHRDRVFKDIDLADLTTYRNPSKKWRDAVCLQFLGRTSTSSARYQDDIFNANALPPEVLSVLGIENRAKSGIVETYIYRRFAQRFSQMNTGLDYCTSHDASAFQLGEFLDLFWRESGLRRSIDKIYEVVVFALFSALVEVLEVEIEVRLNESKRDLLQEFEEFAQMVIGLSPERPMKKLKAKINRVGVTNAADRGLDMWANFGLAIQIKHLSLDEELAEGIVASISADRIVIVCKDSEEKLILSLLNQIGWKSRIQSVVTESNLLKWYEKALRGNFGSQIGEKVLATLKNEIVMEFPATEKKGFGEFMVQRGYDNLSDAFWA